MGEAVEVVLSPEHEDRTPHIDWSHERMNVTERRELEMSEVWEPAGRRQYSQCHARGQERAWMRNRKRTKYLRNLGAKWNEREVRMRRTSAPARDVRTQETYELASGTTHRRPRALVACCTRRSRRTT